MTNTYLKYFQLFCAYHHTDVDVCGQLYRVSHLWGFWDLNLGFLAYIALLPTGHLTGLKKYLIKIYMSNLGQLMTQKFGLVNDLVGKGICHQG